MKIINKTLSTSLDNIELHIFADEHVGDPLCDLPRLKSRIEYVAKKENAYCILNGDIMDFASRSSIGDIENRQFNIMEQIAEAVKLFEPIKDKIICVTSGNHEGRGYRKEGIDVSKIVATQLGLGDVYTMTSAFVFLQFGEEKKHNYRQHYTIYVLHGSGGGRKEGAKAIRLADMASICDADIYIHSHTHLPMIMKQGYHRVSVQNKSVTNVTKLFVNTAANLNYGGYAAAQEYKPNTKDTPVIYLSGSKREITANL